MPTNLGREIEKALRELLEGDQEADTQEQIEQRMREWLKSKPLDAVRYGGPTEQCKHNIEIILSNIRHTEEAIEKSKRGETAWQPEDHYPYLEHQKRELAKLEVELPAIEAKERAVRQYLRNGEAG